MSITVSFMILTFFTTFAILFCSLIIYIKVCDIIYARRIKKLTQETYLEFKKLQDLLDLNKKKCENLSESLDKDEIYKIFDVKIGIENK